MGEKHFPTEGHPVFKKPGAGVHNPPPECGPPLMAGYLVQDPMDENPSTSPSTIVKKSMETVHDLGKKVAIIRGADDNEK